MHNLINATPLYNFLKYCNASSLDKVILDCGAGGSNPPLSLFHEFGYKTYGIEVCKDQINKAKDFSNSKGIDFNIIEGDMTRVPFNDTYFSFLYSYNTSVHMEKQQFAKALEEFSRVLVKGGLCYVNFLSEYCDTYGEGTPAGDGEYIHIYDGEKVRYSHYKDTEIESLLDDFAIIYKEKRVIERQIENERYKSSFIDYIIKKL